MPENSAFDDNTVFTAYVRALRSGDEPPDAVFEGAWSKLHRLLRAELRRRALWSSPPSYLGIYGYSRWTEPDAFEELLVDAYEAVFVDRMRGLETLVCDPAARVDRLCLRNLRHFLHERQKRNDPLGYRVFAVLRGAVRSLVETGVLHVLEGDPRVVSATVLGFAPEADAGAEEPDLAEPVEAWLDDVLPELVTAPPSKLGEVREKVGRRIGALAQTGVEAFRFKSVADPLKSGVKKWRDAVWEVEADVAGEGGDGELVSVVRQVRPGTGYEERQFFDKLVECVSEALPSTVKTKKTGAQLEKYWNFLRSEVAEDRAGELPSRRTICTILNVQRYRIPEFHEILKREVERCRKALRLPRERRGT